MELVVCPQKNNRLQDYEKGKSVAFLFALANFSSSYENTYTLEEIKSIRAKAPDVKIFLALNKLFVEEDLPSLQSTLEEIEKLSIQGIFFYDMAVPQLKNKLDLKTPLVWNQTHMVTNYQTGEYFVQQGVEGLYLSNEITTDEKIRIKNQSQAFCFTLLFGYPVVATSRRPLITNAGSFLKRTLQNPLNIIEPISKQPYQVREDQSGTSFYYHELLNTTKEVRPLADNGIDYGILIEESSVDHNEFLRILAGFQEGLTTDNIDLWQLKMNTMIHSRYEGFANTKTIYKVKK